MPLVSILNKHLNVCVGILWFRVLLVLVCCGGFFGWLVSLGFFFTYSVVFFPPNA